MAPTNNPTTQEIIDLTLSPSSSPSASPKAQHETFLTDNEYEENDENEDEDLKLAIALSLQQHEEDQLRRQDRIQDKEVHEDKHSHLSIRATKAAVQPQPSLQLVASLQTSQTSPYGIQGLDRKTMEAERLARLKRKRDGTDEGVLRVTGEGGNRTSISPPPLRRLRTVATSTRSDANGSTTKRVVSNNNSTSQHTPSAAPTSASASSFSAQAPSSTPSKFPTSSSSSMQTYPQGKVFQTPTPTPNSSSTSPSSTISFSSLLQPPPTLQTALLSTFTISYDWLLPHFSTTRTNFLFILHAPTPQHRSLLQADFAGIPNVKLCFPPVDGGVNCMHSKLIILFWEERCRIVVPTGNLVPYDWGEGATGTKTVEEVEGWMENTVWVIDLPRLPGGSSSSNHDKTTATTKIRENGKGPKEEKEKTLFQDSLYTFLYASTVPATIIQKLSKYDFNHTKDVRFVHSIGGSHADHSTWRHTGHPGLGQAISSLGLATTSPISVDFVTSSLGSLNDEFMRSMYLACQGDDGLTEYTLRNAKKLPSKRLGSDGREEEPKEGNQGGAQRELVKKEIGSDWTDNFRVYFPSHATVMSSKAGPGGAGTICFSRKWWENRKFPKSILRDCVSVREGLLMHNKIIFVKSPGTASKKSNDGERIEGWTYVGSGNLSESAWGRLVQDKTTKKPKLNCRNWECGVVIPVPAATDEPGSVQVNDEKENGLEVFASSIPIPMITPGRRHEGSISQPWFFGE